MTIKNVHFLCQCGALQVPYKACIFRLVRYKKHNLIYYENVIYVMFSVLDKNADNILDFPKPEV